MPKSVQLSTVCVYFTCQQGYAPNPSSWDSIVREPRTSRYKAGGGTRDQIANICWIMEKASQFQKNTYFCFIDDVKALECVDHNKLWKILKEMGIPDHLTCLLRDLHAGQEATVRNGHGTDWFQIGKGVHQAVYCHPAYLTSMNSTS